MFNIYNKKEKDFSKSGEIDVTKTKRGHRSHDTGSGPHKSKRRERRQTVKEKLRQEEKE